MTTFGAVAVCVLSVIGLATLIWSIAGAFLLPVRGGESCEIHMVITAKGDCPGLQATVRALDFLLDVGVVEYDMAVLDAGMEAESKRLAGTLAGRDNLTLLEPNDIDDYLLG